MAGDIEREKLEALENVLRAKIRAELSLALLETGIGMAMIVLAIWWALSKGMPPYLGLAAWGTANVMVLGRLIYVAQPRPSRESALTLLATSAIHFLLYVSSVILLPVHAAMSLIAITTAISASTVVARLAHVKLPRLPTALAVAATLTSLPTGDLSMVVTLSASSIYMALLAREALHED